MQKMAVIIPYRNREEHLKKFLKTFPEYVSRQFPYLQYEIFVVEQKDDKPFNRGKIKNVGFDLTKDRFNYFCFHDVDMLPVQANYSYPNIPSHLAAEISQFGEWEGKGLAYEYFFGGVVLFNKEDFITVNGYSNQYWGYGCEDDDLLFRVHQSGLKWIRREGLFISLPHPPSGKTAEHETNKAHLLEVLKKETPDSSGLSDLNYTLINQIKYPAYTHFEVTI
jgi:predicted glycosyltransferase involved in capsule biosynthesis